jgi:hypothetical protein
LPCTHVILKEEERENLEDLGDIVLMINYKEIRRGRGLDLAGSG